MPSSDALAWVDERIDLLAKHTAVCPACASLTTVDNDPLVDDAVEMRLVWAVVREAAKDIDAGSELRDALAALWAHVLGGDAS